MGSCAHYVNEMQLLSDGFVYCKDCGVMLITGFYQMK